MRRLLRRLAWLIARLFLIMVLSFFVLAKATRTSRRDPTDFATDRLEEARLPLFFNPQPLDLEVRLALVVARMSRQVSAEDEKELLRLGGASFPVILPRLSSLPSDVRERLAWSLLPVAKRMNWRGATEVKTPAQASDYLTEIWKERSVDFQPTIVQRWVERLATRGGPELTATVAEYDTFALPSLMSALPDPATDVDLNRARRLLFLARRLTGLPWTIANEAGPDDAKRVIDHWRRWWRLHALDYSAARGPARWSAMLTQTGFGQWLALAFRHRFGVARDARPIARDLARAGGNSLLLLTAGTLGTVIVGLRRRKLATAQRLTARFPALTFVVASIPPISAVAVLASLELPHGLAIATIAAFVVMALVDLGSLDRDVTAVVPVFRDRRLTTRRQLPSWLFAGHTWPHLLTLVFVVEKAFGVTGLGYFCIHAFRARDLHMLMAITTLTAMWLLVLEFVVQLNYPWHNEPDHPKVPQ